MEVSVSKKTKKATKATKTCSKCKAIQPLTNFYKSSKAKDGHRPECKLCHTVTYRGRYDDYQKQWLKDNPEYPKQWEKANKIKRKAINLKWTYNLTPVDFLTFLFKQQFACADCKVHFSNATRPCVDHSHDCCDGYRSCGKCVRGLVCTKCNIKRARQDARVKKVAA